MFPIFSNETYESPEAILLPAESLLFHGESVDDRGKSSVSMENPNISQRISISYDYEKMILAIDGVGVGADACTNYIKQIICDKNVVLDSTTLGFSELFLIIRSIIDLAINNFTVVYVEPKDYAKPNPSTDYFSISEINVGYKPIPRAIVDLSGDEVEAGVFFLGYESERLERAFEEYQMLSSKDIKMVFGIPAFQPGWELNSIIPHLSAIENHQKHEIAYCAANDPGSAYDTLEQTRNSLAEGNKMFIAPIGTKPCGLAAALHASIHDNQVGLLYDHRKKKSQRSKGVFIWHKYDILLMKKGCN